jgi:UDP-N-acetylmuramyl pentapeptide synthase
VGPLATGYGGSWVETAGEASEALRRLLEPGDVVLVKGSRSVGLETIAAKLRS